MSRQVPWVNWREWSEVKALLFDELDSSDCRCGAKINRSGSSRRQEGLDRVAAWRVRGKVPLAVETTASLIEADMMYGRYTAMYSSVVDAADTGGAGVRAGRRDARTEPAGGVSCPSSVSEYTLRLRYALPLIKLVNGVADSQQRGRAASSVAVLSAVAGLPRCVVDLRHDASHHELPSLKLLRLGSRQALHWLRVSYWEGQASLLLSSRDRLAGLVTGLLDSCREAALSQQGGRGGQVALDDDDDEMDGQEGGSRSAYVGSEGRRRRRELTSQLRAAVPTAWTYCLADALLDTGCLDPPGTSCTAPLPPAAYCGTVSADAASASATEEQAWAAAMRQMIKAYPTLRLLLLLGATKRLCELALPQPGTESKAVADMDPDPAVGGFQLSAGAPRRAALLGWALRLLPNPPVAQTAAMSRKQRKKAAAAAAALAASSAHPTGSGCGGGAAAAEWLREPLSVEQMEQLLSMLLLSRDDSSGDGRCGVVGGSSDDDSTTCQASSAHKPVASLLSILARLLPESSVVLKDHNRDRRGEENLDGDVRDRRKKAKLGVTELAEGAAAEVPVEEAEAGEGVQGEEEEVFELVQVQSTLGNQDGAHRAALLARLAELAPSASPQQQASARDLAVEGPEAGKSQQQQSPSAAGDIGGELRPSSTEEQAELITSGDGALHVAERQLAQLLALRSRRRSRPYGGQPAAATAAAVVIAGAPAAVADASGSSAATPLAAVGPRWRLAEGSWSSCAIGYLPCSFNPAGRTCCLSAGHPGLDAGGPECAVAAETMAGFAIKPVVRNTPCREVAAEVLPAGMVGGGGTVISVAAADWPNAGAPLPAMQAAAGGRCEGDEAADDDIFLRGDSGVVSEGEGGDHPPVDYFERFPGIGTAD